MGGVQFAFLTLPLHSQRELCIVMFGTGCKFFRIFIVGAHTRSYMNLLRPHILQPVCLVSYLSTSLPTYRYTTLFPSIHPTTYLPTYLLHTHTHIHSILQAKVRTSYCRPYHLSLLSVSYSIYWPKKKRSDHEADHNHSPGVQVKNKEDLRFTP